MNPTRSQALAVRAVQAAIGRPGADQVRLIPTAVALRGSAVAGTIDAVGVDVVGFAAGDRVAHLARNSDSSDVRLVDVENLIGIPKGVSDAQAAALLASGLAARVLVKESHAVGGGETVLVHAASGSLGSLIVGWARLLGASVIASVGSAEARSLALRAGAHHVVVFGEEDVAARVFELTGGRGVDVVYDGVGEPTRAASIASLRAGGELVLLGPHSTAGDYPAELTVLRPRLAQHLRAGSIQQGAADLFLAIRAGAFDGLDIARLVSVPAPDALAA